jgi:membrane-associated protease RseP (regulator of RpoE activity)
LSGTAARAQADPGSYAGKRLAVVVTQNCDNSPGAASFLLDEDEDDCSAAVLESIGEKISSVFASKGVLASVGGSNVDLVLTVTITKRRLDTGVGGYLGDFTARAITAANYALANSAGTQLTSGTVSDEDGDDSDGEDMLERKFANKLVAEVMTNLPAGQSAPPASPPRFGVQLADLAPSRAEGLGHPGLTGVQVIQCLADSLADRAGIKAGDVIYEFDGKPVMSKESFAAAVAAELRSTSVVLKILRGRQVLDIQVQF